MTSPSGAISRLRRLGWHVEPRSHVLAGLIGPLLPLPDAACWGHVDHPPVSPLWVWHCPADIGAACRRIWDYRPQDSVLLLGTRNDDDTWQALWHLAGSMPLAATVWVLSPADLRRGIARRVYRSGRVWR